MITILSQVAVPEASELAMSYYRSGNVLWILQWLWIFTIPLLFLITGFSAKLGTFAEKWGKRRFFSIAIYLIGFVAIYQLLTLPLEFYGGYLREHSYGLSTQTLGRWFENFGKSTFVMLAIAIAFTWIFYLLLKKSPKRWWFYGGIAATGIFFILAFVFPIWIDPLFNTFGPMKDKQLEKQISALAAKAGIGDAKIYEVDKSKDTTLGNAYVCGIGSTKRIVIWDTIIDPNHPEQLLFIVGHEMGHYVLHHVWLSLIYYSILAFVILYLTDKTARFLLRKYHKTFKINRLSDISSLPLLLLLISVFLFLQLPLFNCFSRYMEREADRFGMEITGNCEVAAQTFADFASRYLANPRPGIIFKIWRSDHPALGDRIDFCNNYCSRSPL